MHAILKCKITINGEETITSEEPKLELSKKQKKIDRIKNIILEGAINLLSNHPYEDISMNDIADEVALSRATIYNYFSKKEDIYFGILTKTFEEISTKYLSRSANPKSEYDETLLMAKILFKKLHKQPLVFRIYVYLLAKLQELNISGEDLIINNELNIDYIKSQIPSDSDNESFINLIKTYNAYVKLAFSDTIKNSNPNIVQSPLKLKHLYYMLSIIINGYGLTSSFPLLPYSQIKSTNDKIVQVLLELVEKLAKGDISIDF